MVEWSTIVLPVPRLLQHCNGAPILKRLVDRLARAMACERTPSVLPDFPTFIKKNPRSLGVTACSPSHLPEDSGTHSPVRGLLPGLPTAGPPYPPLKLPFRNAPLPQPKTRVGSPELRPAWEKRRHPLPHPRSTGRGYYCPRGLPRRQEALATDAPRTHSMRTTCEMQALRLARLQCCIASQPL